MLAMLEGNSDLLTQFDAPAAGLANAGGSHGIFNLVQLARVLNNALVEFFGIRICRARQY